MSALNPLFAEQYYSREAFDKVFSLVYEELRRIARGILQGEREASLTPTALVNEAWLKLSRSPGIADTAPLHFKHIAARAMRQVLVEAARRRHAHMRGNGVSMVTLDDSVAELRISDGRDVLALDAALEQLGKIAPRQAQLVESRFFAGLDVAELSALFRVSESTVMREWRAARAWLAVEIRRTIGTGVSE